MTLKKLAALLLWIGYTHALSQTPADTIEQARKLAYEKKYTQAITLLQTVEKHHPKDINAVRLHGQILYWMQDPDAAFLVYEAALQRNPNQWVALDYGRMLFEMYHLTKAKAILKTCLVDDSLNVEALNTLGSIAWLEGHTGLAKTYFQKVTKRYPQNEWANKYLNYIVQGRKPWLGINTAYNSDSQPLHSLLATIETGWYTSWLLSPKINATIQAFNANSTNKQLYAINASNECYFAALNLKAAAGIGVYRNPVDDKAGWTASLELKEKLDQHFSVTAYGVHQPVFYTIGSLQQAVTQYNFGADLLYNTTKSWSAWAGYNQQHFMDGNNIFTASAGALSPALPLGKCRFFAGYAVVYSTADSDRYQPGSTVTQVLQTNTYNSAYDPYFTPRKQWENALLINMVYQANAKLQVAVNTHTGLYTLADKPYFYLNYNNSNQLEIQKGYYAQHFIPVQLSGSVSYAIAKNAILKAGYTYMHTFFYNSHQVTLNLKLNR